MSRQERLTAGLIAITIGTIHTWPMSNMRPRMTRAGSAGGRHCVMDTLGRVGVLGVGKAAKSKVISQKGQRGFSRRLKSVGVIHLRALRSRR